MKLKPESEKERYRLIKQNKNTKDKTLVTWPTKHRYS